MYTVGLQMKFYALKFTDYGDSNLRMFYEHWIATEHSVGRHVAESDRHAILSMQLHGSQKLKLYLLDYYRTPTPQREYATIMKVWRDFLDSADAYKNIQNEEKIEKQRQEALIASLKGGKKINVDGGVITLLNDGGKSKTGKAKGDGSAKGGKHAGASQGKGAGTQDTKYCMMYQKKWHGAGFTCERPKGECKYDHVFFPTREEYDAAWKPDFFIKKVAEVRDAKKVIAAAAALAAGQTGGKGTKGGKGQDGKGKKKRSNTPPPPEVKDAPKANDPRHLASGLLERWSCQQNRSSR